MVKEPVCMTVYTSTTRGSSRYILGQMSLNLGSSERFRPFSPMALALKWTMMKMPAKYRKAGRMARTMMVE